MDCKKVRDVLMTDYLDQELDPEQAAGIEKHLEKCPACREFLGTVRGEAKLPANAVREIFPDAAVWQKIQERIGAGQEERTQGWKDFADILMSLLKGPRLIFSATFVTAVILVVVFFSKWPTCRVDAGCAYTFLEEQMTAMDGLRSNPTEFLKSGLNGYAEALGES